MAEEIKFTIKSLSIILVILTILSICASAVIAYSVTNETAKHNTGDIQELKLNCKETMVKVDANTINVAVLNTIADDVAEIKRDIKEFHSKN